MNFKERAIKRLIGLYSTYSATHNTSGTQRNKVEKELSKANGSACSLQIGSVVAVIFIQVRIA